MNPAAELLHATLLMLVGIASAIWIGRARRGYGEPDQPALFCVLLAFSLAAGAGASAAARLALGAESLEAERWLLQATRLLGLPLVGAAAICLARRWAWSRPTWGRIIIGLCAFFELARQLDWSAPYAFSLGLLAAAMVGYAGFVQWPARLQTAAGLAAGLILAIAPVVREIAPTFAFPLGLESLCLAVAIPLIGWLVLQLPGNTRQRAEACG